MSESQQPPLPPGSTASSAPTWTITELLDPRLRGDTDAIRQLEKFRIEWERIHGPVDLTRRYVTAWPAEQQDALFAMDPKRWWDALPPVMQDFYFAKLKAAARDGALDSLPDAYVQLYMSGQLARGSDGRAR